MTRRFGLCLAVLSSLAASPASALVVGSGTYHQTSAEGVRQADGVPQRPLTLQPGNAQVRTGLGIGLSDVNAGKFWVLPIGAAFGLFPELEVGVDMDLQLASPQPWAIQNLMSVIRLYGRYLLLEEVLALEAALYVPTANTGTFGLEVLAPTRLALNELELYGQGSLGYAGSALVDSVQIAVAATALYPVIDELFVAVDLGFNLGMVKLAPLVPEGPAQDWSTSVVLPVGVGLGYRILDDLHVKGTFTFLDLADENDPIAARAFLVTLVQLIDLSLAPPPRAARPESEAAPTPPAADADKKDG
jgi:hypothetical protein